MTSNNCEGYKNTKCDYLHSLNKHIQTVDDNEFDDAFEALVRSYPGAIIKEKEIVYILLFMYYLKTEEVHPGRVH